MKTTCAKLAERSPGAKTVTYIDILGAETATRLQALRHDYQASLRSAISTRRRSSTYSVRKLTSLYMQWLR